MAAAAEVLGRLSSVGIRLEVHGNALHATPRDALTDDARTLIRKHKADLLALLTAANDADPGTHRLWTITRPEGSRVSVSRTPPSTLAELQAEYPGARIEPEALCTAAPAPVSRYLDTDRRQCSD
ncbi:hypothetical protein, partial [Thiocystis violacea]|uniref:TubC N-terminal docking domain-related protein n=1 Tax=Thiocystis violacea TaxID=13725 RepID=UPI001906B5EA